MDDKRRRARQMADEFLGRSAGLVRAAIGPVRALGRLILAAGIVIWAMVPAPVWKAHPTFVVSLIALVLLLAPGARLLRHQARMRQVLDDLPTLTGKLEQAFESPGVRIGTIADHWREIGSALKPGRIRQGRRLWRFYHQDIRPLREGPGGLLSQLTDALAAFNAPALLLSAVALAAGLTLVALAPVALLFRLLNLG